MGSASLLPTFYWQEFSHKVTPHCKEGWDMLSSYIPRRKEMGLMNILSVSATFVKAKCGYSGPGCKK